MSSSKQSAEDDPKNLLRIWGNINAVVIGFFSSFIFTEINQLSDQLEVALATIAIFAAYMVVDMYIRAHLSEIWSIKGNSAWQEVLLSLMNFVITLGIFLIVQYFLLLLSNAVSESNLSIAEKLLAVYGLVLISFSTFQSLQILGT
jgi:hypothetical protein